jgi:DNA-binding beta-propeller fold protein YncE
VVAWDAYKEDENYVISWVLDTGSGTHKIPKGSSPTAVAVDPAGRYIAFSTTTSLNIGNTKDTVVVLRTVDGQEVFRRYLAPFNRTGVIFLGDAYFAYSDSGTTHVLHIE